MELIHLHDIWANSSANENNFIESSGEKPEIGVIVKICFYTFDTDSQDLDSSLF